MSGLINFIKSLFSGIFSLFGGKKKSEATAESEAKPAAKKGNSGFFLELDEAKEGAASQAAAATNGATAEAKSAKSSRKEKLAALAEGKQSAAATPASAKASTAKPAAAIAPKPAAVFEPETEFATKYLVTNGSSSRRRPGANMSSYLDMARKIKAS